MVRNIFTKIIGLVLQIKYRFNDQNQTIHINSHLTKVRKVLVFMPTKIEQFGVALHALENLIVKKPHWKITVITKQEMSSILDSRLQVSVITFSKDDINIFGLPKSVLKSKITNTSYDLALDFVLNFNLVCIKLFQLSSAPLRACFDSEEKTSFYNFGIRVNAVEDLAYKYNAMIKYITMIGAPNYPEKTLNKADHEIR